MLQPVYKAVIKPDINDTLYYSSLVDADTGKNYINS